MVDADSRPSFKELVEIFENWSSDPGRYIVIQVYRYAFIQKTCYKSFTFLGGPIRSSGQFDSR